MRASLLAVVITAAVAAAAPAGATTLQVPIDHSVRLSVAGAAASVVVGNPSIADVTVVDSHTLFVSGRGFGATDVVVLDQLGRTIYAGEVSVGGPAMGHVAVYRGGDRTDLACSPSCQPATHIGSKAGGGESSGAPAAAVSAANSASNIAGASLIAHAVSPN